VTCSFLNEHLPVLCSIKVTMDTTKSETRKNQFLSSQIEFKNFILIVRDVEFFGASNGVLEFDTLSCFPFDRYKTPQRHPWPTASDVSLATFSKVDFTKKNRFSYRYAELQALRNARLFNG
jgi:hypothetical protein